MNYEDEVFRQMFKQANKSHGGFAILCTLAVGIIACAFYVVKLIVKGVQKMLAQQEDKNIQREVHRRAVSKFLKLLGGTNFTLYWNAVKSHTNRSTGELTQYINFTAFNEEKRAIEIINMLINEVLHDTLTISNSKDIDLAGTIVSKNDGIYSIQENLQNIVGTTISFRNF